MSNIFEDFYALYSDDVFRFAFWLSGNRADAEEIAAEAFLRLWTCKDDMRSASVKGYLLVIAKNLYISRVRKTRRVEPLSDRVLVAPTKSPSEQAELRDDAMHVFAMVQKLPLNEREAILLRAQQGLDYKEIADCLGIAVSAVKARIHRARIHILTMQIKQGD